MSDATEALRDEITGYLATGGLFNPELANHNAVRDLLIACREALASPPNGAERDAPEGWKLVPIKYTVEQMDAAYKRAGEFTTSKRSNAVKARAFDFCTGYRVMVEAAPEYRAAVDAALAP